MEKLNVLELSTTDNKGGAALVAWNLKKELERSGHTVSMIVGYKRSNDSTVREIYNTLINRLASRLVKRNVRARFQTKLTYLLANDVAFLPGKKIRQSPEFKAADIIHAHNLHSGFFNLKALPKLANKKPLVWTLHDMWPLTGYPAHAFDCPHWPTGGCDCVLPNSLPPLGWNNTRHLWKLKNAIYQKSRVTLVAPSQWMKKNIERSMLKDKPVHVIYNGIDDKLFKPTDKKTQRQSLGLPLDKKIVLFASKGGAKNIWKGWIYAERIIEQYRDVPEILFICLGGYGGNSQLSNIKSVEYVSDPYRLASYYATADILLYPSIADNCPLTVLEALACGLPVLTFNTGGIPELVAHQTTGYVAAYRDQADLLNGFKWLISLTAAEQEVMSAAARTTIEQNFTVELMTSRYLALYYSLLN